MPNSFAGLAQRFPAEKEGQSLEEQVRELRDYSYQLLEYLRYALQHLDPSNFNEKEMEDWITKPIAAEIRDVNGNIAQMKLTAEQFAVQMSDANSNIAQLAVAADTIAARMENVVGDVSLVQQQANNITLAVSGLSDDLTGVKSTMVTVDKNGMIVNTKGDTTSISGATIKTGTITANHLQAGIFEAILKSGNITAFDLYEGRSLRGSFFLSASNDDIHLASYDGDLYVTSAEGDVEVSGDVLWLYGGETTVKVNDNGVSVDNDVWVDGTKVHTSDRNAKNTVTYDLDAFDGFYRTLKPCRFKYNNGKSGRFHSGFIAQEVEQAVADAGFVDTDLAVVVQENHGTDEAGKYGVRYEEIIALNTAMIQKLMDENDALKARVADLEGGNDAT